MKQLYKNICKRRKELGMTQTELALKTGYLEKSSISRIEKGEIDLPISKIEVLAKALDCSVGELLDLEKESPTTLKEDVRQAVNEVLKSYLDALSHS